LIPLSSTVVKERIKDRKKSSADNMGRPPGRLAVGFKVLIIRAVYRVKYNGIVRELYRKYFE
jgi:hypothetical protein